MLMKSNRLFTMGSPYLIVLVGPTCHDHLISSTVPPMVQIWSFGYGQACVCRKPTHVAPDDPVLVLLQPSSEPQSPKSKANRGSEREDCCFHRGPVVGRSRGPFRTAETAASLPSHATMHDGTTSTPARSVARLQAADPDIRALAPAGVGCRGRPRRRTMGGGPTVAAYA
jgi:hypothetical protein